MAVLTASLFFCGFARAENHSSDADTSAPDQTLPSQAQTNTAAGDGWHTNATFYFWLPGVHGNYNAFGYSLGFKASVGDLLPHADLGLMGVVGIQHKRLVMLTDLVWTPLTITKTRVFNRLPNDPVLTAEVKYTQFFLTPEIGYRALDGPKLKIDGLAGFRYWHQGTTLTTTLESPLIQSRNTFSTSKDFADPLVGARILFLLSPKVLTTILGDVGGWGVGSQLDYQILGALTYKIAPKWGLTAAWRYLYLDYSSKFTTSVTAQSGILFGVTYSFNPPQ